MIPMLRLQFIIFSLIGIGFFTRKKGLVSREGQKNITDLVINIILPCNIVTSFLQELPDSALRDCVMIFLISVAAEALCMLYTKYAYNNVSENQKKCLTYGILVSNAGFLGNPVAEGVYGPMGLMLASVYLIPVRIIMWSKGIAIFSGQSNRKDTLRKVITHPCVIACAIGIVIMLTDGSRVITDAEVAAFIGSECRGAAFADEGLYYLLVAGEGSGQPIEIRANVNGSIKTVCTILTYVSDGSLGTPWEPFVIDINDLTGINDIRVPVSDGVWYTLQGIRYGTTRPTKSGVYLYNGKKVVIRPNHKNNQ